MIGHAVRPLAAIPSEFSGRAKVVGCLWCRAVLMLVMDENGRGTTPLDVQGFDLADSPTPGFWYLKGGWIHATPHRCHRATSKGPRLSFRGSSRIGSGSPE
jgi:hypothetical protein